MINTYFVGQRVYYEFPELHPNHRHYGIVKEIVAIPNGVRMMILFDGIPNALSYTNVYDRIIIHPHEKMPTASWEL